MFVFVSPWRFARYCPAYIGLFAIDCKLKPDSQIDYFYVLVREREG